MTDAKLRAHSELRWRRLRASLKLAAIIGAALVDVAAIVGMLLFLFGVRLSVDAGNWFLLAGGFWFAHGAVEEIGRGRVSPGGAHGGLSSDYVRSADPIGFWVLIGVKVALAGALVVAALGRWLGFWNVWP